MSSHGKSYLRQISKDEAFLSIIEKLTKNERLTFQQNSVILTLAVFLINCYKADQRRTKLLEFAYYLILKYSIFNRDYAPLLDLATNLGYFPISTSIIKFTKTEERGVDSILLEMKLSQYSSNGITQTLQQRNASKSFLSETNMEKLYIAPTSFGKSSLISDYIRKKLSPSFKVAVITPTKSLLHQTYRMIRDLRLSRKIILHDEMYENESTFISVLTQERALRLVNRYDVVLDALIIDEAHNLLDSNERSILLSRLIKICRIKNPNIDIAYLSPLLNGANAIKIDSVQNISTYHIRHNIKEPEINVFNRDGEIKRYNRFVDKYFGIGRSSGYIDYIKVYSLTKNFIYTNRPPRVEKLAMELQNALPLTSNDEDILELKRILAKVVHPQYNLIKCLGSGIIYIHGKTPDLLKDYLEYKFKTIKSIKYIVANSVILEGVNLPIDSLFILNVRGLHGKDLTNLIGRVNRLDAIFDGTEDGIRKLLPSVHFVHAKEHMQDSTDLEKRIRELKSTIFNDVVDNPTLSSFDKDALDKPKLEKVNEVIRQEVLATSSPATEFDAFTKRLIEEGIPSFYNDLDKISMSIYAKAETIKRGELENWKTLTVINKLHELFISEHVDEITDYEFKRLRFEPARRYYNNFIFVKRKQSLSQNVAIDAAYLASLKESDHSLLYFGSSFGEVPYISQDYLQTLNPVYIDVSKKSEFELVNLAVVKNKLESDFVSYTINRFIVFMWDSGLISEEEYLLSIYGTTNMKMISLTRSGLSLNLITRLDDDNQLGNISIAVDGEISGNNDFARFTQGVDDFYRFELSKFISWK